MGNGDGLASVFDVRCARCGLAVGVVRLRGGELMLVDEDLGPHERTCPAVDGSGRQKKGWPVLESRPGAAAG